MAHQESGVISGGGTIDTESAKMSATYRNYVLAILTIAYAVNVVDRQILAILMEPIKRELGISDTQLGLLSGVSFAIFYSLAGIPIAIWADRGNRRNIITLTLTVFSGMTVLSGFAMNFVQLMLARIGVAIGESGGSPASHSMISDMFPAEKRTTAMGIYASAVNMGVLVGFFVGGWISQWYGWRAAFFIVGAPGLLVALAMRLTVREPVRGTADGLVTQGQGEVPSLGEVCRFLWSQRSFRHIAISTTLSMLGGTACYNWLPAFFARSFSMAPGEIGTALALTLGLVGAVGTYVTGRIADLLGKRDVRWNVWSVALFYVTAAPLWAAMYLSGSKDMALLFFLYPAFIAGSWVAVSVAMTQALVTVRMRTRASALLFLIMSLIGGSIGPQLTGILSDLYAPYSGHESLRYALLTTSVAYLWAGLHLVLASRTLKADIERVRHYRSGGK